MRIRSVAVAAIVISLALPAGAGWAADTTPPTAPTNLRVTASTGTSVTLAWNAASDNSCTFSYVLTDNFFYIRYPHRSVTSITLTSLSPNTAYVFTLRAFDAAQN